MKELFLSAAILPAAIMLANCAGASTGETPSAVGVDGEAVELEDGLPFTAASYGTYAEPWAIEVEPGTGNVFITEKAGTAKLLVVATGDILEVSGMPEVGYGGQGGLGDVVFAPDYSESGTIYLSWAKSDQGDARRAVAGMGTLACDDTACTVSDLTQIWQQEPAIESFGHFSHRLAFSPDGQHLFITSGDRMQQDPAQDLTNNLGTVVRLNPDGSTPEDNPFAQDASPSDQIWSYGQRNMLGIAFDPAGNLWEVEHGPRGGDELNLVEPGNNYGWPVRSYGINYSGVDIPDHTQDDGFVKPAMFWTPVIAPGDMIFYSGAMWPEWAGDALIANLGTTSITRIETDAEAGTATEAERFTFGARLRSIAEAADGSLWVAEDGPRGRLLHLTPAPAEAE